MEIKPIDNRVLVKLDRSPEKFAGGELELVRTPDGQGDWSRYPKRGVVLAIGPNVKDLEVGDYIISTPFNGVELPKSEVGEEDLMLIREEFVLLRGDRTDSEFIFGRFGEFWPGEREKGFEIDERRGVKRTW
jgi:co-chaperonin GroES (HSP10)